jgi:hypothetical protein
MVTLGPVPVIKMRGVFPLVIRRWPPYTVGLDSTILTERGRDACVLYVSLLRMIDFSCVLRPVTVLKLRPSHRNTPLVFRFQTNKGSSQLQTYYPNEHTYVHT